MSQAWAEERAEGRRQLRRAGRRRFWRARWDGLTNYAKHLVSGAMSAVVSRSCVAPFERVKMEMLLHQVMQCLSSPSTHV